MRFSLALLALLSACNGPAICSVLPVCFDGFTDADGDGFMAEIDDCDDDNADVNPDAEDIPCNGVDEDCDGFSNSGRGGSFADADGDGFGDPNDFYGACDTADPGVTNADDCDDANAEIHPGTEDPPDGVDNDCDGLTDEDADTHVDADADGFTDDVDCDDSRADIHPEAEEICDGVDDDCNGLTDDEDPAVTDQGSWYADADHDGYGTGSATSSCTEPPDASAAAGDCNDGNPDIHPGADEWDCLDPTDYNCDGVTGYTDQDMDGYAACEECDDTDPTVFPGAEEICDGVDNDCNGLTDDADSGVTDPGTFYADLDHDGYGNALVFVHACTAPSGYVADMTDCDDAKSAVHPGGTEVCDAQGVDEDCDGAVNDADTSVSGTTVFYRDTDGDGYGGTSTVTACVAPSGYTATPGDCKDTDTAYHPGASETSCSDPNDYNCDGVTGFVDQDGDGTPACQDCNDANANIHPGAVETCNGVDDNCNGTTDGASEAVNKNTYYQDADGDGFGKASSSTQACTEPSGYVANQTDCNDGNVNVNPSALEICNGVDDDCDALVDDADSSVTGRPTFYRDADGDGYGSSSQTKLSCTQPSGYVANQTDCDDARSAVNPAAIEVCDSKDNDCDGLTDDQDASVTGRPTWYVDADADGYGSSSQTKLSCAQPSGYVANQTDCNDAASAVHPGAVETCNGVDDNCAGGVDEGVGTTYYQDADADGYGKSTVSTLACTQPSGYVTVSGDCDDHAAFVHPGVAETKKTASDDNCDGTFAHTDGVTTFTAVTDAGSKTATFTGSNLVTDTCSVTMGCGSLPGWTVYSYSLLNVTAQTGPLAFTSTLGGSRNAALFDNTGGAAAIQDECRGYFFPATVGNKYGITFLVTNRASTDQLIRVYRATDYAANRATAPTVYSPPYLTAGTDTQIVTYLTAGSASEGFVLCAGGVSASNAVGFTEVWIGPVSVQ